MSVTGTTYELHGIVAAPEVLEPLHEQFPHARPVLLDGALEQLVATRRPVSGSGGL